MRRLLGGALVLVTLVAGCGSSKSAPVDPSARAVTVYTTACGDASRTTGSGVLVDDGHVLTAAHVVVGATQVSATPGDGVTRPATVVHLDTLRDLALLEVEGLRITPVEPAPAATGQTLTVEAMTSGPVPAEVVRPAQLSVDEVRGSGRSTRAGYELATEIDGGDSGAGVFDAEGRLVAIVFAVPTERDAIAWATAASEVEATLVDFAAADPTVTYRCDPDRSRVVPKSGA